MVNFKVNKAARTVTTEAGETIAFDALSPAEKRFYGIARRRKVKAKTAEQREAFAMGNFINLWR